MKKTIAGVVGGFFLGAILWTTPVFGADVNRARPGTLNYVEGQASIGNEAVNEKSIGTVELEPGQTLATQAGKVEVLLTPGVFFRVGDNSVAKMVSPNLTNTEVELLRGNATVEVTDIYPENSLRVVEDGKSTQLVKRGLYDFDADHQQVRVFDGQAEVQDGSKQVKIKGGREVDFNSEPVKARKFDKQTYEASDLYRWSSLRSSYLAEANADAARTYVAGGPGWWGLGWYWDPWFDAYTFIPGDGIFYSPFGWGFYSPGFAYYAPIFWGGRYYHHFGSDYRAWGPGYHYGMPYHYGHGVVYGARSGFAGRGFGGGEPHGFSGGGFHGAAGGFHGGGGFVGGGFHR
jgi:hypothetical protein